MKCFPPETEIMATSPVCVISLYKDRISYSNNLCISTVLTYVYMEVCIGHRRISHLSPHDALRHHFTSLKTRLNFPTTKGFRVNISMKLEYQYMAIFSPFSLTSSHLHPLQVENCDSNSRLVVDEDHNVKSGLKRLRIIF